VLLSPFGDSISPLSEPSQLIVGRIESSFAPSESWMRVTLYLTQSERYCEFVFMTGTDRNQQHESKWYWVDATPNGPCKNVYGPDNLTGTGAYFF
jgi:hypothetical protein